MTELNSSQSISINLPTDNPDVASFFQKYGNDPVKVVEGYNNMQARASKSEQYAPARDYAVPDGYDIPDPVKSQLVSRARSLELSTNQFKKMLEEGNMEYKHSQEAKKQAQEKRLLALGGKDGMENLKTFYADKLPSEVIDAVLNEAGVETLLALKNFKEKNMSMSYGLESNANNTGETMQSLAEKASRSKEEYFAKANELDELERTHSPNHPKVTVLRDMVQKLHVVHYKHMKAMEKHAENDFTNL